MRFATGIRNSIESRVAVASHRGQALHNSQLADWIALTLTDVSRRPILNSELPDPSRAQGQSPIECLAAIAGDQTLTEPVRQRALQFAREWK